MMTRSSARRARRFIAWVGLVLALVSSLMFGARVLGGVGLLRSAVALDEPAVGELRAWMSTRYVAELAKVAPNSLAGPLGIRRDQLDLPLREIAGERGQDRLTLLRELQGILARQMAEAPPPVTDAQAQAEVDDWLVGWILAYGYPVLALSLMLGAMGAPLPSGLSVMVVGVLAGQGRFDPWIAAMVATLASVLGDLFGYLIGSMVGEPVVRRHGHWIGLSAERLQRARRALARWGPAAIVLSRSLVSFLSSAVNLLAGSLRQPLRVFIPSALLGRALWSTGYLLIGMLVASGLHIGSALMRDLSGLVVSLLIAAFALRDLLQSVPIGRPVST
ncbi:MAG: DedA family protein [Burkholderiaceae bacterium]